MSLGNQHIGGCYGNPSSRVHTITVINVIQTLLIFQHHSYSRKEQKPWLSTEFSIAQSSAASLLVLFLNESFFSDFAIVKLAIVSTPVLIHFGFFFFFDRTWSRTRKVGLQLRHRMLSKGERIYIFKCGNPEKNIRTFCAQTLVWAHICITLVILKQPYIYGY